jgi:hypothetical protein
MTHARFATQLEWSMIVAIIFSIACLVITFS